MSVFDHSLMLGSTERGPQRPAIDGTNWVATWPSGRDALGALFTSRQLDLLHGDNVIGITVRCTRCCSDKARGIAKGQDNVFHLYVARCASGAWLGPYSRKLFGQGGDLKSKASSNILSQRRYGCIRSHLRQSHGKQKGQ